MSGHGHKVSRCAALLTRGRLPRTQRISYRPLPAAAAFVKCYESTIRQTAKEIVDNMTARGWLRGRELEALVARLRAEVETFTQAPAG